MTGKRASGINKPNRRPRLQRMSGIGELPTVEEIEAVLTAEDTFPSTLASIEAS